MTTVVTFLSCATVIVADCHPHTQPPQKKVLYFAFEFLNKRSSEFHLFGKGSRRKEKEKIKHFQVYDL